MKFAFYFFVAIIWFSVSSNAQKKRDHSLTMKGDENCRCINTYSAKRRLTFYPFSIANTIQLVSFRFNKSNVAVRKDSILADSLIEIKVLTQAQVDKLTDILYNNFYKVPLIMKVNHCAITHQDMPFCLLTRREK